MHLRGCCRSRSASSTSLTKYTEHEARVKTTTAASAPAIAVPLRPSSDPVSGAANTSRFLGHCRGRAVSTAASGQRTQPGLRASISGAATAAGPGPVGG
jgi:hypothetical protein